MLKKTKNQNKGITLIALVITVIVLLILAGIGISMLSGDNNILKRAGEAKDKTELESLAEEAKIVMSNRTIEKTTMGTNSKTLKQDLESGISGGQVEEITKADGTTKYTDVCYVTKNGKTITVYEDGEIEEGKVSIWKGATDIECPEFKKDEKNIWNWYIYTAGQLKFLADFVNNGNSLNGTSDLVDYVIEAGYETNDVIINSSTNVYLMQNLDMGARQGNGDTIEQKWETDANNEVRWMPIGSEIVYSETGKAFIGNMFEGNNHIIRGVYVNEDNSENEMAGIFSGNTTRVSNLTVKNSYIKGKRIVGGIAALARYKFKNCKNINSTVIATDSVAGGIVGVAWKTLEECSNDSNIISEEHTAGGIVGQRNSSSNQIINCKNSGTVIVKNSQGFYAGGIVGNVYNISPEIKGCINNGKIKGGNDIGGILGSAVANATPIITECDNNGTIEGKNNVGGIVGNNSFGIVVEKCDNNGSIEGDIYVGGIVGVMGYKTKVEECNNSGQVIGKTEYTGGIVGLISTDNDDPSDKEPAIVSKCYNSGKIQGTTYTGGVIGTAAQYKSLIEKCYNLGEVTGTGNVGGIAGSFGRSSRLVNCYNINKVTGTNNVGGIAGNPYSSTCEIKNCYNIGNVSSGTTNLGGILGNNSNSSTIENSYYLEGTATLDVGSGSTNSLAKNKEYITQDFVTTANATETIWKVEAGKNDGWPILNE